MNIGLFFQLLKHLNKISINFTYNLFIKSNGHIYTFSLQVKAHKFLKLVVFRFNISLFYRKSMKIADKFLATLQLFDNTLVLAIGIFTLFETEAGSQLA